MRKSICAFAVGALLLPCVATAGVGRWTSGGPYGFGDVYTLAVAPTNPSVIYAGTLGGVFRSTDAGETWRAANRGIDINSFLVSNIAVDPATASTLWAATGWGLVRSTDSGESWAAAVRDYRSFTAVAIDPRTPSTVYGGWWFQAAAHPLYPCPIMSGFSRSTDAGATWRDLDSFYYSWYGTCAEVDAIVVDPVTPSTVYVAATKVFKSTDSGMTWAVRMTGLSDLAVHALLIDPNSPSKLYAGTTRGVFESTDSGGTWIPAGTGVPNGWVAALASDPSSSSTIYAGTRGNPSGPGVGIFKSTDAGGTWAATGAGAPTLDVLALRVDPSHPSTVFVGTKGKGAFRSTDSGGTWESSSVGITTLNTSLLAVSPSTPSTVYASTGRGIFRSTDSGGTWSARGTIVSARVPSVGLLRVDPALPSTLYATGDADLYRSTDAGATWDRTTLATRVASLVIDPLTPSRLWAGTSDGVFRSTDAGHTWTKSSAGLTGVIDDFALAPAAPSTLYAVRGNTWPDPSDIFLSTNGGDTWMLAGTTPVYVRHLAIAPTVSTTLYAYYDSVYRSTDSGKSWVMATAGLGFVKALVTHPTVPGALFVGTHGGGVFRSTDSGGSWVAMSEELAQNYVDALAIAPTSPPTLFAGLTYGSVWQLTLPSSLTVPIILSIPGLGGAHFTSELALTNPGTSPVSMTFTYSPAFGGTGASASDTLDAGKQKIVPDAIAYLRSLGMPLDEAASKGGTLRVDLSGPAAATIRTTTAVPSGRAGLAYRGLTNAQLLSSPVFICGLRQNDNDRSNVAVLNAGAAGEGEIALRLTVVSGDPAHPKMQALPDITLAPGEFRQVNGVLAGSGLDLTNGYVKVERVSGSAPFYAYGVVNDNASSDGSFVEPVPAAPASPIARATLPVLVETRAWSTELVVTNFSASTRTLHGTWVSSALTGGQATFDITLLSGEQQILPSFVQLLRDRGDVHDASGPGFAGAVFFTDASGDLRGVSVAARAMTPGEIGRYGVFYPAVPAGAEVITSARLYDLRQDAENRTNLALVNVGSADSSADTFRIEIHDGATGRLAGTVDAITVPARGFFQIDSVLTRLAPGVANAWAVVTRTSGSNPFIAYAVLNDGGRPGERSGDGAFLAAEGNP